MNNLLIFLHELQRGPKEIFHTFSSADLKDKVDEYIISTTSGSIDFKMTVEQIGGGVLLTGHYTGQLVLMCSRCTKEFDFLLNSDFKQVFIRYTGFEPEDEIELSEDELETDYYVGDEINIEPYLKDLIALEIPMVPLCSPNCQGINYNMQSTDIKTSPWSILKNLKIEPKDS